MLNVFLTVDTEIWPFVSGWPKSPLPATKRDFSREYDAYILGRTRQGDFGVPFQIAVLNRHCLKANYFVESLAADAVGRNLLRSVVALIAPHGHDIQLHLHTEWMGDSCDGGLPFRQHLHHYVEDDQARIIARGIENLVQCGAPHPSALRAGNYGANVDTLKAARRNRLRLDTSYNYSYRDSACPLALGMELLQPREIEGVVEFPVSHFSDFPGHTRHAQVCACSVGEMTCALQDAFKSGWYTFVIVLHSFELVRVGSVESGDLKPDWINIRRFERLCEFLDANRDKFRTQLFSSVQEMPTLRAARPLRSRPHHTARRLVEQLISRLI
jgi:hypothetical protein